MKMANGKTVHALKAWPEYFQPMQQGLKMFEVRFNDRDFKEGDLLFLSEWLPESKQHTGHYMTLQITYILKDFDGLAEGWVVLGLGPYLEGLL